MKSQNIIQNKLKICNGCGNPKKITTIKPISKRSEKRIIQDKQYSKLRKQFLIDNPVCIGNLEGCTYDKNLTIQHKKGRVGIYYLDITHWCTLCLSCHTWVNEHPYSAIQLGLAKTRLNKE